ncbi:MAG: hypothetical protein LBJ67_17170 [Planctomycetaceae bacterium]|nr:hypothetical protein [Planctomycetaceae bacterium]
MQIVKNKTLQDLMKTNRNIGWTVVRFAVAAVLLVAAGSKAYQLATMPILKNDLFHNQWLNIIVVDFEFFFGFWLLFGLLPKLTWLVSVVCFSSYALISFWKASILYENNCGCFGMLTVNPWLTMTLDLILVGLLLAFRPKATSHEFSLSVLKSFAVSWLAITVPVTIVIVSYQPNKILFSGEITGNTKTVLLEPESWTKQEFPLTRHVIGIEGLEKGNWVIVLYRNNCEKCHELFKRWITEEIRLPDVKIPHRQLAIVSLDNGDKQTLPSMHSEWQQGILNQEYKWSVTTPVVIRLNDKIVNRVYSEHELF